MIDLDALKADLDAAGFPARMRDVNDGRMVFSGRFTVHSDGALAVDGVRFSDETWKHLDIIRTHVQGTID